MRKFFGTSVVAISAAAMLALAGCGSGRDGDSGSGGEAAKGFAANSADRRRAPGRRPRRTGSSPVTCSTTASRRPASRLTCSSPAVGTVADQQNQITAMITKGAKVIVIGAIDGAQLATQVKAGQGRRRQGHRLRPPASPNTPDVDYYVAYDNFKVGELQGQALLDGMKAKKPNGPYNIELFAGSPDDANAEVFFDGAMNVLKPKIDDGTLVGRLRPEGRQADRHPGLEGRERADPHGHAARPRPTAATSWTASCPRTTPWPAPS